jgi:hypothetical protein
MRSQLSQGVRRRAVEFLREGLMGRLRAITAVGALLAATLAGCRDATAPEPAVVVSVEPMGLARAPDVAAEGRLASILIRGGRGLTCGVSRATGAVRRRGDSLRIDLAFRPLDSCPFSPTESRYEAVVSGLRSGQWYDVTVMQQYWAGPATEVLRSRVFVP